MKISINRPKCDVDNLVCGMAFLFKGEYYIKTTDINKNGDCYCVALCDGSTTYFNPYQRVELIHGEFVITEK